MATPLNILIVEDSADDALLLVNELQSAGFDPAWKRVETEPDYDAGLAGKPEIIFSDFTLPQFSTKSALTLLKESRLEIPFIIVSGTIGEERAVESLKAGATDYVLKDRIHRLGPAVHRALREVRERAERVVLEDQLRQAQKIECLGQLAGGVAHDFNNLLAVIRGSTELVLTDTGASSDKGREHLKQVLLAADRGANLVRQLLAFSRKQELQLVPLNLNRVVENVVEMISCLLGPAISLDLRSGSPLSRVRADAGMLEQVIMNLAINARDAMPYGGQLTISTADVSFDVPVAPQAKAGGFVCLEVTDTGSGISPNVLPHIFEPFFTTKAVGKGTGLGLATVHGIVHQHQGWITVESEVTKGTTFRVYLPALTPGDDRTATPVSDKQLWGGSETVLVVEDEAAIRAVTCEILKRLGYNVIEAGTGVAALEIWRNHRNWIDLVLTDIVMPGGISGLDMARILCAENPSLRIIFTSGYSAEIMARDSKFQPGVNFLEKPYPSHELARLLRKVLDQ